MRKFLGFTPDQASMMLRQKGFKANSREAAEYLAGMYDKAQNLVNQRAYQYGGQVGGFDDKSNRLFDAAVKRTASTEPKSPEVQRYLDNVIETRGKPTMVFPGTADPLVGYQEGGLSNQRGGPPLAGTPPPTPPEGFKAVPSPRGGFIFEPIEGQEPATPTTINPFPTRGVTPPDDSDPTPREKARDNLNKAQAKLAEEQQNLSNLQQKLAGLDPSDESLDEERKKIADEIENLGVKLTSAEAAVASASGAFGVVATPTAAEAVGTATSTPEDILTRQPVDLLKSTDEQLIATDKDIGEVDEPDDITVTKGETEDAEATTKPTITKAESKEVAQKIRDEAFADTDLTLSDKAKADAQEIATEDLNIRDVEAATTDKSVQVKSPAKRKLEQGELISGAANAERSALFLEGIEAATGAPSNAATVQGQLTNLMSDFEGGKPPPWAAGAMRQATAIMAQRGLAASSMAGQAIVQAAMESALPIAMQDAQTVARFEEQNLSNRQQRAMLAAQQRAQFLGMEFDQEFQARVQNAAKISDIANTNFSAEVQIALENSRLAQTTNLTNLGNKQAVVMAQAAAIADADMANLNNRQQAAIRNADAFLQTDMKNFDADQQNDMFKNQSIVQGLFTDIAAENAASQFNASSQNQTDQFFAKLETQVSEFNAAQENAMSQYNAGEENALEKFQASIKNQRDMFNAQNQLVIAQANAQWRQQLATINNAAQNEANRQDALQANALTQKGLDEIWQRERDIMAYAFTSAENAENRRVALMQENLNADAVKDSAFSTALGTFAGAIVNGIFT